MAIQLEFISLIVPIEKIEQHYSGGFDSFKRKHIDSFGGRFWHDDYLFRDGAMNSMDIQMMIDDWQKLGLKPTQYNDGQQYWEDLCIVSSFSGLTLPCLWLEQDLIDNSVYLKAKPKGRVIGADEMREIINNP